MEERLQETRALRLIVSAWLPEQESLIRHFAGRADVEFLLTGIGPLRAAAAVAHRLARGDVAQVLFVGTAGAYDGQACPLLSAWGVSSARFTDGAAALGCSYFPATKDASPFEEWVAESVESEKRRVICVCPPSITRDETTAVALAKFGELENLEIAAVATACAVTKVPWQAFLGVSNAVGPNAHEEWKAYHAEASRAAQAMAQAMAQALAQAAIPGGGS